MGQYSNKGLYNAYKKNNKEREENDYYATPTREVENILSDEELESYEYETAEETHIAIPSYIGYQLVKSDDVQLAQILMDEWNRYMSLFDDKVKFVKRRIGF